jgi:hypothetical protein
MPFIQQGAFSFLHANQPDNLSAILTADQIKNKFDSQALELKTTLNNLIIALGSTVLGDSGAKNIGTGAISGVTGATVQDMLINLKSQIDANNLLSGGNVTGNLTVSGIVQGNNSIRSDSAVAGQTTLVLKNSADDAYLRFFTTSANNYLASSNYASTVSKNLLITGYSGNNMTKLTLNADNVTVNGTITEGTTLLTAKYAQLATANTFTGAITINNTLTMTGNLTVTGSSTFNSTSQVSIANFKNNNGGYLMVSAPGNNAFQSVDTTATATKDFSIEGYGGANITNLYLKANTISGMTTINATTLQEGGTNLSAKYAQLGANTFTAGQTISSGGLVLNEGTINSASATNDGKIRTAFTPTLNYIQSGNNAGSSPKNLTISGYGATTMNECNIVANTLKINGQPLQSGSVTIVPVANTPTKVTVTFPTPYSSPPHVVATGESAVPGSQMQTVSVANITSTTVDIYLYRTNTTSTNIHWIAMI